MAPYVASGYAKTQAVDEFKTWSQTYDDSIIQKLLFVPSHNAMLEQLSTERPRQILDIGGGTGIFAQRCAELFPEAEVWALDLSMHMLSKGSHRLCACADRLRFVQADSEHLPFADNRFDIVTCANSFHHYPNQEKAIREMHRVLRPGGRLLIVDGCRDTWWGHFIYDLCVVTAEGRVDHLSGPRFRQLFQQCGFVDIEQKVNGFRLAPFIMTQGRAYKNGLAVSPQTFTMATTLVA